MALTPDQAAEAIALLEANPAHTDNEIRAMLQLPGSAMFSIRKLRKDAGIPQPASTPGGSSKRRRSSKRSQTLAGDVETETLDDLGEPSGPKRSGTKRPQSLLAPILPRLAQSLAVALQAGTYNLTHGVAPMSREETAAIAIPVVRIADRTAAKYIKKSGKVTPNQEDFALIALTVGMWAIGWIMASLAGRTAQPRAARPAPAPEDDLFGGSEPSAPAVATVSHGPATPAAFGPAAAPVAPAGAGDGDGDLFAGSEPLAAGAASAASLQTEPAPLAGPGRAGGMTEAAWQAIMPTDLGEALAG